MDMYLCDTAIDKDTPIDTELTEIEMIAVETDLAIDIKMNFNFHQTTCITVWDTLVFSILYYYYPHINFKMHKYIMTSSLKVTDVKTLLYSHLF